MIEAYAIGVSAKLEDQVTPGLLRIIDSLGKANAAMLDFAANARNMSRLGLTIGRNLEKAAAGATALGDSASGLTRASYVLDTMAASSADVVRNLKMARAESLGMGRIPGGGAPPIPGAGGGRSSGGGSPNSGRSAHNAIGAVAATGMFGLYENARLQDTNIRAAATAQLPMPMWIKTADELRTREFAYARKFAFATSGHIAPFGAAMLESSRLLRTLSPEQQRVMTDTAMPYAAVEAKLKGIPLPEAMQAFIGLAHQAGAYSPAAATPLFESMMQASLTTHAGLNQIARAASYALPALHAAGANSPDVMLMLATMMQAGIMNTKSGTWLNSMALNALPNTLGSGLFKNKLQNQALEMLGLYKGGKSQFYKNGQFDLMSEVAILAAARTHMAPEKFNAALRQGLGMQGQRAASLFSEPQVVQNLSALRAMTSHSQAPVDIAGALKMYSTVGKADQTIANANMTIMNMSSTLTGPANSILDKLGSFFGWTADYTKRHPLLGGAMDAGLIAGTIGVAGGVWKGIGFTAEFLGKKVMAPVARGIIWMAKSIMTNPWVMGFLAAAGTGYAAGSWLNKKINAHLTTQNGGKPETLGALYYDRLHHADGSFRPWGLFTTETPSEASKRLSRERLTMGHAASIVQPIAPLAGSWMRPLQQSSTPIQSVAPARNQTQTTINNKIVMPDGRVLAEVVTKQQAQDASRPFAGATGFDWGMGLAPVALGGGF